MVASAARELQRCMMQWLRTLPELLCLSMAAAVLPTARLAAGVRRHSCCFGSGSAVGAATAAAAAATTAAANSSSRLISRLTARATLLPSQSWTWAINLTAAGWRKVRWEPGMFGLPSTADSPSIHTLTFQGLHSACGHAHSLAGSEDGSSNIRAQAAFVEKKVGSRMTQSPVSTSHAMADQTSPAGGQSARHAGNMMLPGCAARMLAGGAARMLAACHAPADGCQASTPTHLCIRQMAD